MVLVRGSTRSRCFSSGVSFATNWESSCLEDREGGREAAGSTEY